MKKSNFSFLLLILSMLIAQQSYVFAQTKVIMNESQLASGYDMGMNSSQGRTDWLSRESGVTGTQN